MGGGGRGWGERGGEGRGSILKVCLWYVGS